MGSGGGIGYNTTGDGLLSQIKIQSNANIGPLRKLPEVEVIKLNSAKIYRFLQLLSDSRGFFARV